MGNNQVAQKRLRWWNKFRKRFGGKYRKLNGMFHGDCVTRFLNSLPFVTRDHYQGSIIEPQHNLSFENPMELSLGNSVALEECPRMLR